MSSGVLRIRQAIGAAATISNVLSGTDFEMFGGPHNLTIWANGDIAGMTASLRYTPADGVARNPMPTSSINIAETAGEVDMQRDFLATFPIPANARLVLAATNPGAASNVTFVFQID